VEGREEGAELVSRAPFRNGDAGSVFIGALPRKVDAEVEGGAVDSRVVVNPEDEEGAEEGRGVLVDLAAGAGGAGGLDLAAGLAMGGLGEGLAEGLEALGAGGLAAEGLGAGGLADVGVAFFGASLVALVGAAGAVLTT
jgi:hypothetical protein